MEHIVNIYIYIYISSSSKQTVNGLALLEGLPECTQSISASDNFVSFDVKPLFTGGLTNPTRKETS